MPDEEPNAAEEGDGARLGIPLDPDGCGMPDPFLFMWRK